jgi:hypothetical protein
MKTMKSDLTVVAISSNTNAFGLKNIILFRGDGRAFQGMASAYNLPFLGQCFAFMPTYFECMTEMPRPPRKVFKAALIAAELANLAVR